MAEKILGSGGSSTHLRRHSAEVVSGLLPIMVGLSPNRHGADMYPPNGDRNLYLVTDSRKRLFA
jgi:hypothetical protein